MIDWDYEHSRCWTQGSSSPAPLVASAAPQEDALRDANLRADNAEIAHQQTLQRVQKAGELLEALTFWPSPGSDQNLARDIGRVLQGKPAERSTGVEEALSAAGAFAMSWKQAAAPPVLAAPPQDDGVRVIPIPRSELAENPFDYVTNPPELGATPQECHEPGEGSRIVSVYRDGSWMEESPAGWRRRYWWPTDDDAALAAPPPREDDLQKLIERWNYIATALRETTWESRTEAEANAYRVAAVNREECAKELQAVLTARLAAPSSQEPKA